MKDQHTELIVIIHYINEESESFGWKTVVCYILHTFQEVRDTRNIDSP